MQEKRAAWTRRLKRHARRPPFRRPTKLFQDAVAGGRVGYGGRAWPEGVIPIVVVFIIVDGKVVGTIGLSGGSGEQDRRCQSRERARAQRNRRAMVVATTRVARPCARRVSSAGAWRSGCDVLVQPEQIGRIVRRLDSSSGDPTSSPDTPRECAPGPSSVRKPTYARVVVWLKRSRRTP